MRCIVLFYTFCFSLQLLKSLPLKVRRIIGGIDADDDKYRYIVRLEYQITLIEHGNLYLLHQMHRCTASVLTPIWTLTAAHCFQLDGIQVPEHNVSMRPVVTHGPRNSSVFSKVMYFVPHPTYSLRMLDLHNDIALIRHEPIKLKQYAHVSGLDYLTMAGLTVTLAGYGITNVKLNKTIDDDDTRNEVVGDATTLGKPLQVVDVVVIQCSKENDGTRPIFGGMCLARACGKLSGLCPGDSGGPLLHTSGVVGVNSIGSRQLETFCSLKPHPVFYDVAGVTPTSPYIDWISSTIENSALIQ